LTNRRAAPSRGALAIAALAILLGLSVGLLRWIENSPVRAPRPATRRSARARPGRPLPQRNAQPDSPSDDRAGGDPDWVPADGTARVAIVIDDVGFDPAPALELASLSIPLTFAVLPGQAFSRDLASRLAAGGHEVILHMPMEPVAYPARDPGDGAVSEAMTPEQAAEAVSSALRELPEARGLNNHMGSRITSDPVVMRAVLGVVRARGLYFLDSRTTPDTVAYDLARAMGIPALKRSVFLDDRREGSYIEGQVKSLLRKAREEGSAVAIGHANRTTAEALRRAVSLFREEEVRVVPASELAARGSGESG
jgi:hypothetical protein